METGGRAQEQRDERLLTLAGAERATEVEALTRHLAEFVRRH
jgi:hypothetical protein